MALSDDDKQEILELLRQQNEEKQKSVVFSKENLTNWLLEIPWKVVEAAVVDLIWHFLCNIPG